MLPSFRKSLLALAVTSTVMPVYAQTLALTNSGLRINETTYDSLDITGTFEGAGEAVVLDRISQTTCC